MADQPVPLPPGPPQHITVPPPTGNGVPPSAAARTTPPAPADGPEERPSLLQRVLDQGRYLGMGFGIMAVVLLILVMLGLDFRIAAAASAGVALIATVLARAYLEPRVRAQAAAAATAAPKPPTDSTREVVETIVFVVVLVLLLKSFAAEAFVIPTGSMAQTLWGYQKLVTCPTCETEFPVNCSSEVDPTDGHLDPVIGCTCPNCRQKIHFLPTAGPDYGLTHSDSIGIPDPGPNSGDRVLVSKAVYSLFGRSPNRLDVVVFKFPGDSTATARFPQSGPYKNYTPMNYIKRLIGLSGETIAICGGKLYVLPPNKAVQWDDYEKAKNDPNQLALLWRKEYMHENEGPAPELFRKGQFQIIRKKPENILAMMRPVYDNDHPAKDLIGPKWQRWVGAPGSVWKSDDSHGFTNDGSGGEQWLRYRNVLRENNGKPSLIGDFMGYNTGISQSPNHLGPFFDKNWVGDLILECEVTVDKAEGEFLLEVSRTVDRFQARWDLASGACTLWRLTDGKPDEQLASKPTALKGKGTYRVRLANVDQKLTVWVDGRLPFDEEEGTYLPPARHSPTQENDLERPASVGVKGAAVRVGKLKLFRDTYYTTGLNVVPSNADVPNVDFTDSSTWPSLDNPPLLTLYVQPDHFLCLGDNSQESSDGRSWGTVPRRLLLGRALLVYWPFSRAGRIR